MSHHSHSTLSTVGHLYTETGTHDQTTGVKYDAERDAHKEKRQLTTCSNFDLASKSEVKIFLSS